MDILSITVGERTVGDGLTIGSVVQTTGLDSAHLG